MNFLEKYNLDFKKALKGGGVIVLALIFLFFIFRVLNGIFPGSPEPLFRGMQDAHGGSSGVVLGTDSISGSFSSRRMSKEMAAMNNLNYSSPVESIIREDNDFSMGRDAEDFEVTSYRANIETRNLKEDCNLINSLKVKDYIIFENSNQGKRSCNFRFKVKRNNVEEVLAVLKSLNPKELNENIETIKKQIENFISEEDILKKKLQVIDDTLSNAISSYDEISRLATKMKDASSLASTIESKIRIIERLSQEKINTSARLDRISKNKAEKLDQLEYVYFNVYVYENEYIDIDNLKDSWKNSVKKFVRDINRILQSLSFGLIMIIINILEYALYLILFVFVLKYVWKILKKIWYN